MVRLGARTDQKPKRSEVEAWTHQFAMLYGDLLIDCNGAAYHRKRIQTIEKRLQDSAYLREHSVSHEAIVEAERAVALHWSGLERREERIQDRIAMFPGFWRGRPAGVDEWLTGLWFMASDDPDPVIAYMLEQGAECWPEVEAVWRRREPMANTTPCPY